MTLNIKKFDELSTRELFEIYKLRVDVFVVEQNCAYHEIDDDDLSALHIFLSQGDLIKAYLRVIKKPDGVYIGRVVTKDRGKGLGARILSAGIAEARKISNEVLLEAQTYARGFYEKAGFSAVSDEFPIDGIPHIKMRLSFRGEEK